MIYAASATLSAKRALRAAFEPARWVDENETYVEFEAQGGCPPLITLICRSGKPITGRSRFRRFFFGVFLTEPRASGEGAEGYSAKS